MVNYSANHRARVIAAQSFDGCDESRAVTRLNQAAALDEQFQHRDAARQIHEQTKLALLKNPIEARIAWAQFGWLLGIVPPAAIFLKFFNYGFYDGYHPRGYGFAAVLLAMNLLSGYAGRGVAKGMSRTLVECESGAWTLLLVLLPLMGLSWGMVTGAFGGLLLFGVGAIAGAAIAMPIGATAFLCFGILHRLISRAGFLERRYFLPLAWGICLTIAAFVLGWQI